jgi:hypothetical protein
LVLHLLQDGFLLYLDERVALLLGKRSPEVSNLLPLFVLLLLLGGGFGGNSGRRR